MFYRYIYICIYRYKYIQRVIIDFDVIIVNQLSYLNMTFDSRCVLLDVFIFVFCWHLTTIFAPILGLKMPADLLWKWSIKNWMGPYHWTPFSSVSCDSSLWSILRVFSGSVSSVGPVGNLLEMNVSNHGPWDSQIWFLDANAQFFRGVRWM